MMMMITKRGNIRENRDCSKSRSQLAKIVGSTDRCESLVRINIARLVKNRKVLYNISQLTVIRNNCI